MTTNVSPRQTGFDLEPEYAISDTGTEHEFRGGLLIPTAGETARLERERVPDDRMIYLFEKPKPKLRAQMNPMDALRLRAKGQ